MEREQRHFLKEHEGEGEQANGFYPRTLRLTLERLNLKVPRVRYAKPFRPAILPPCWKRVDKDYEELLIAMLANGYSRAQLELAMKNLRLPFSPKALEEALDPSAEKLDFYKTQPLKSD
ncbi:transposase [Candidatus Bipolaricaulota bacterium]|nr:transposase [Candidatus Bipolaricaulota bacterium]